MRYVANPVVVEACKISHIVETTPYGIKLCLENGEIFVASCEMVSRIKPQSGDYWVQQEDGYVYLTPKQVFERKYSPLKEE